MNKKRTLQNNLSYALKYIFDNYGINIFLDSEKFILTLSNLIPTLEEEIELVKFAIEKKALLAITNAHYMRDIDKEFAFLRAKNILIQSGLSEKTALYLVDCFVYAFNWTNEIPNYKDLSDEDLKLPTNTSDKNNITAKPIIKIEKNVEPKIENKNINVEKKDISSNPKKEVSEKEDKIYKNDSKYYLNHNYNDEDDDYEDDDDYKSTSLFKKIALILIPIIVLCSLGFFVFKGLNKEAVPVVSGISITTEYKTKAGNYILPIAQETDLNIILESENFKKIDESKLDYSIEDSSICTFESNGKKCKITGIKEGNTKLIIMYDDKVIDSINLYFEDFEKKDEDEKDSKEEDKDQEEDNTDNNSTGGNGTGGSNTGGGGTTPTPNPGTGGGGTTPTPNPDPGTGGGSTTPTPNPDPGTGGGTGGSEGGTTGGGGDTPTN